MVQWVVERKDKRNFKFSNTEVNHNEHLSVSIHGLEEPDHGRRLVILSDHIRIGCGSSNFNRTLWRRFLYFDPFLNFFWLFTSFDLLNVTMFLLALAHEKFFVCKVASYALSSAVLAFLHAASFPRLSFEGPVETTQTTA